MNHEFHLCAQRIGGSPQTRPHRPRQRPRLRPRAAPGRALTLAPLRFPGARRGPRRASRCTMKQPTQHWEALDKLILVAGHAVYISAELSVADRDENWVLKDFQKGEPPRYIEHIRFGVELAESQPKSLLVFSGGQPRLEACPRSEARSYYLLADQFG